MILEFSIANTFSISEKQTISFEAVINDTETDARHYVDCGGKKILKLACIYGANAAGKTKMLEALQFYMSFLLHSFVELKPNDKINFIPFGFSERYKNMPGEFELVFYTKDLDLDKYIRYDYEIKLTENNVVHEALFYAPKGQKKRIFERDNNKILWGSDITGPKKIIEDMTRKNSSLISAAVQVQQQLLLHVYNNLLADFIGIVDTDNAMIVNLAFDAIEKDNNLKSILIQLLSASDMGLIQNIESNLIPLHKDLVNLLPFDMKAKLVNINGEYKIKDLDITHYYDETPYSLSILHESAGTVKMIGMTVLLTFAAHYNPFFLIDELESSLHQELVELFLDLFLEISDHSQLLFTTHNQDLLDSGLLRDDEVWFCYKTMEGNSVYNSITDYKGVRKEASRKKLYNADKFGALPNININLLKELFYAEKNRKNIK